MLFRKLNGIKRSPLKSENVEFSYSDSAVLSGVSLKLKKGEILAVIGKSGSGKSTFLKLASGVIGKGYSGKISIFGMPKFLKKDKIGFVPQDDAFIPDLSLEDNIRILGLNFGVSERVALENARNLMKQLMLDESLKKKPGELSGGQRVRLNIILSLLHDPDILIMDEPFTGLDYKNRRLLWHFLNSMQKRGKSIVLTSHLLSEIQENVNRIVILKDGKVFFSGDLEKLKRKLSIQYIFEIRYGRISRENYHKLRKFCILKDVKVLDYYDKYMMFGIGDETLRSQIVNFFKKINVTLVEVGFREPNLDEIFMSP
jgi:ABC-2 type transport system ATP-binding protein